MMDKVTNLIRGRRDEISASDVTEQYDAKINQFLLSVNGPGPRWWPDVDLLGRLFAWGDKVWTERNKLQSQLSEAEGRIRTERNRLQSQVSEAEERIRTDRKRFQTQLSEAENRSKIERNSLQGQLSEAEERIRKLKIDLASAQRRITQAENDNDNMKTQHRGELDTLKNRYSTVTKKEKDIHGREVKKLVGQLLVNQDDNLGWTDDKLKFRFQQLQNLINSLVSPHNKEYRVPPDSQIGRDLDPTGFLARTTRSKAHFLLQNTLWAILYEQFFSTPFGFGVLGDGEGQKRLLGIYISWVELLGKASSDGVSSDQAFEFFHQSKAANNWRSATFQCINEVLMETSGRTDASAPIATLIMDNVSQTTARITSVLLGVSKLSGSSPRSEMEEVQQIVHHARDLALQFGVHTAQLQLHMPEHGAEVQIGDEVHDCEDGDCDRGAKHFVDLVTLPGLQKLGDGRSDMQSKRILVPCEIYPD